MSTTAAFQSLQPLLASNLYDLSSHSVVAVITGGGTGIGLNIAKTLATNGAKVYIVGIKKEDVEPVAARLNAGLEELSKGGTKTGRLVPVVADASKKEEAERLAKEIGKKEPKGVTVLFNNAGIAGDSYDLPSNPTPSDISRALLTYDESTFSPILHTNLLGPYFFSAAFLPLLANYATSYPSSPIAPQVIMTCSINSYTKDLRTGLNMIPYILSKAALKSLVGLLAGMWKGTGVRVNAFAPGWFITGMTSEGVDELGQGTLSTPKATKLLADVGFEVPAGPQGGRPEDVGMLAMMLVCNRFINGETVLIDGGSLLVHPGSH